MKVDKLNQWKNKSLSLLFLYILTLRKVIAKEVEDFSATLSPNHPSVPFAEKTKTYVFVCFCCVSIRALLLQQY
jgi:hypothetical protein